MFRVGQKVVCIAPKLGCWPDPEPGKGDICTVTRVYSYGPVLTLELAEFPTFSRPYAPGWMAEDFRPVVERKTDISIFTAMLTPTKRKVLAVTTGHGGSADR
jgi:hypothetical protein